MILNKTFDEKNLHWVFELGLILKGIFALLEILAGIVAYFISQHFLLNLVLAVFHDELIPKLINADSSSPTCAGVVTSKNASRIKRLDVRDKLAATP